LAISLLKTDTLRQSHRKRCANGCGQRAVARDLICNKDLCWFHLWLEHPHQVDGLKLNGETFKIYDYYGP
jgi:hypothetical protein